MSNIYVHTRQRTYNNVGVIWSDAVVFLKRSNKKCNCRNISDDTFNPTIIQLILIQTKSAYTFKL